MVNIVGPCGGRQPQQPWRELLQRLEPLELPLLAVGAGDKRKAPADPATGRPLSGWQTAAHTVEQLRTAHPQVIAAGTRTGADAGGLLAFDVDGATALSWLLERGCDPEQTITWQVHRDTDTARLKVLFRLSPKQQQQLGQIRTKANTGTGEAVELFHGSGQVILIGEHPSSGGHYHWPDHMGPEALAPLPECWFAAALEVAQPTTCTASSSNSRGARRGVWQELKPCPICGRESGWCAQHEDGRTLRCFQGSTYSPPLGLKPGEEITDRLGTVWAFSREQQQSDGHVFSVFVTPDPERRSQQSASTAAGTSSNSSSRPTRLETHEVMGRLEAGELGQLRLNVRSGDVHAGAQVLTANEISRAYLRLSSSTEKWPKETTCDAITELANQNRFDPVEQFLKVTSSNVDPLPMEQWQRLDQHLLGIDDPIAAAFLPRYLISAVARVFEPGASVRQVPVLVGPQWRGKSALGRILFGAANWVEGIGELGKDDLLKCHTAWGVELAELDGVTRRSDQEKLKAFLTERTDTYRKPYDRAPERHDRRFVFFGTSNAAPLRDSTGSTRFVTIAIPDRMLPLDWAEQNRDAIWSRAVEQYRAGVQWDVCTETERAAIAARNEDFTEHDPWFDGVRLHLERRRMEGMVPAQIPAILDALGVPTERQGNRESKRVRQIAESLGWSYGRKRVNGERVQGLWPVGHTTGHTGHTAGHTTGHTALASDCKGSAPLATPATPKPKELKKEATHPPSVQVDTEQGAAGKRNFPIRGGRGGRGGHCSDAKGSAGVATDLSGVAGVATPPEWLPAVLEWLAWEDLHPAAIANRLMAEFEIDVTGRQVKEVMAQFLQETEAV